MPLEIVTVPCLSDNYAFLIHAAETGETAVVDVPEAAPVQAELTHRGWMLSHIFITHHHYDHIQGVDPLRASTGARVFGARADAARLPALDVLLDEGGALDFAGHNVSVMDVSGHTVGHIAYYIAIARAAFTADSLMALGCGRIFEGTPEQMWDSLSKLTALPAETLICSGHEYTAANARFAKTIEPDNEALAARAARVARSRAADQPTVPSTLAEELDTNPFLRARLHHVKEAVGMSGAADSEVFAEIRRRKDAF